MKARKVGVGWWLGTLVGEIEEVFSLRFTFFRSSFTCVSRTRTYG